MRAGAMGGVIFDLDGTLYTLPLMKLRLTLRLLPSLPIIKHLSRARDEVRLSEFSSAHELREAFGEALGRRAGIAPSRALSWYDGQFYEAFLELLGRRSQLRPKILPRLSALRTAGIKLAVVSDFGKIEERLQAIGVPPEAFDIRLSTESLGALKPWPRAFSKAAEALNLEPSRVLVVGDRPEHDGQGASAAGMMYCGVIPNSSRMRRGKNELNHNLLAWSEASQVIAKATDSLE